MNTKLDKSDKTIGNHDYCVNKQLDRWLTQLKELELSPDENRREIEILKNKINKYSEENKMDEPNNKELFKEADYFCYFCGSDMSYSESKDTLEDKESDKWKRIERHSGKLICQNPECGAVLSKSWIKTTEPDNPQMKIKFMTSMQDFATVMKEVDARIEVDKGEEN